MKWHVRKEKKLDKRSTRRLKAKDSHQFKETKLVLLGGILCKIIIVVKEAISWLYFLMVYELWTY